MIQKPMDPSRRYGQTNCLLNPNDLFKCPATYEFGWIYFLWDESELVYVGQSHNVVSRVFEHKKTKQITDFSIQPCHAMYLDQLEAAYINIYKPKYNIVIPKLRYSINDMMQHNFMFNSFPFETEIS